MHNLLKSFRQVVIGGITLLLLSSPALMAAAPDAENSADYPDIGRFQGAWITYYDAKDFDEFKFVSGKVVGDDKSQTKTLEGRVTRIGYHLDPGPSILEVTRNVENKLKDAGYDIVFTCKSDDCGGADFAYNGPEILNIPFMWMGDDFRYLAAHKSGDVDTYAAILVSSNNDEVVYQLMVAEVGTMENRMVDAKKMASSISETGKIALYGILFDYDKADIKPESRPALDQIGTLMKDNPDLKIIVVGHTDNQGSLEYNLSLSTKRAQAIVADLTKTYDIDAGRMTPAGAAFLAPVASNRTEDGQAQNRRVELVER